MFSYVFNANMFAILWTEGGDSSYLQNSPRRTNKCYSNNKHGDNAAHWQCITALLNWGNNTLKVETGHCFANVQQYSMQPCNYLTLITDVFIRRWLALCWPLIRVLPLCPLKLLHFSKPHDFSLRQWHVLNARGMYSMCLTELRAADSTRERWIALGTHSNQSSALNIYWQRDGKHFYNEIHPFTSVCMQPFDAT